MLSRIHPTALSSLLVAALLPACSFSAGGRARRAPRPGLGPDLGYITPKQKEALAAEGEQRLKAAGATRILHSVHRKGELEYEHEKYRGYGNTLRADQCVFFTWGTNHDKPSFAYFGTKAETIARRDRIPSELPSKAHAEPQVLKYCGKVGDEIAGLVGAEPLPGTVGYRNQEYVLSVGIGPR